MSSLKNARIAIRVSPEQDEVIRAAAAHRSQSVTDFMVGSALDRAERDMADRRRVELSPTDWDSFVSALDEPPRANDRLVRTIERARNAA